MSASSSPPGGQDDPLPGQVVILLTLMRDLQGVMRLEGALLRSMRLDRLRELQAERTALAKSYQRALQRLRQAPEALAELDDAGRALIEVSMRAFQAGIRSHAETLAEARAMVEDMRRAIDASLGDSAPPHRPATSGRVIAVAFGTRRRRKTP